MIYLLKTKKPIEQILYDLPLTYLVQLQLNVESINNIKDEKEEIKNVSELCK